MTRHFSLLILLLLAPGAWGQALPRIWSDLAEPVNTVAPGLSGTPEVGETLTCSQGTYTGGVISRSYVWKNNGSPISNETASTLDTTGLEAGDIITAQEVVVNAAGSVTTTASGSAVLGEGEEGASYPSGYSDWIADVLVTADHYGDLWVAGTLDSGDAYGNNYGQYEPAYVFRSLNNHYYGGEDAELETQSQAAGDAYRTAIAAIGTPYAANSVWNYTRALADDYLLNGDTASRTAVAGLATVATYAADSNSIEPGEGALAYELASRECAYVAMAYMQAEACGESYRTRLAALIRLMLGDIDEEVTHNGNTADLIYGGHIEQWLGDYTTDSAGDYVSGTTRFEDPLETWGEAAGYAPFMGALTAYTLIYHYEHATQNGTHQGGNNSATLTVDDGGWVTGSLVGRTVNNVTDGSSGTITANSGSTVTATLSGGTDNDWDSGDTYEIVGTINGGAVDADADTIPKLTRLADATWNECWEAVPDSGTFYLRPTQGQEAMALNNLIATYYWWLYLKTGEARFLSRADEMFNNTVDYASLTYTGALTTTQTFWSKEFCELTRFTFDGLAWRSAGVHTHE